MLIGNIIKKGFVAILLTLDSIVYDLVGKAYNIFMAIAGARLLSSDAYMKVANKVYIIVGVLVLFVLSYSILRAIVDPDKNMKEELGAKLVRKIIVAVVGLAMTPIVFNLLYQAQGLILENNILGNIFFNDEVLEDGTDPNKYITDIGGAVTATSLWEAFFYPSEESGLTSEEVVGKPSEYLVGLTAATCIGGAAASALLWAVPVVNIFVIGATAYSCISSLGDTVSQATEKVTLKEAYTRTAAGDSFKVYLSFINNYIDDGEIKYLFIISTIAGGFALYAFISFSIDMGVRAAKLAYLQIVAPIPLVMQIVPSREKIFDNWYKSVISAFLEVFIRISVVYVVVYIICHIPQLFSSTTALWGNSNLSGASKYLALALLILGLIAFCRKAPDIIAETLDIPKGDMKLGLRQKLAEGGAFTAGSILGGGITSAVHGFNQNKLARDANGNIDWKNKSNYAAMLRKIGGAGRGFFGAAGRAALDQIGPEKKEALSWQDMLSKARDASRKTDDKMQESETRRLQREEISKKKEQAEKDYIKAEQDLAAAQSITDTKKRDEAVKAATDRMKALRAEMAKLDKEFQENTELGNFVKERGRRIKIWAAGTVDLSVEEAAIRLGGAMGNIQDKLRAEAEKKDVYTKALARQLEQEQSRVISRYKDGYTEESYNEALRDRLNTGTSQAAQDYRAARAVSSTRASELAAAHSKLDSDRAALDSGRASGLTEAQLAPLIQAVEASERAVSAAQRAKNAADEATADALKKVEVELDLKYTDEEMAILEQEQQVKIDGLKKAKEARSDEWAQVQLAAGKEDMQEIVVSELRQHMDLLSNHPNLQVPIKNASGETIYVPVIDIVNGNFGANAAAGQISAADFQGTQDVEIELNDSSIGNKGKITVKHKVEPGGKETYEYNGTVYQPGQYTQFVQDLISRYGIKDVKTNTASAVAKDQGKQVRTILPTTEEYARKAAIKREAEKKS